MINLSDYNPIDNRLSNHLMPFSALCNHFLFETRTFVSIPLYFFHIFSSIIYGFINIITTLSHMIYIYEYKLIEQRQSNHLTPF